MKLGRIVGIHLAALLSAAVFTPRAWADRFVVDANQDQPRVSLGANLTVTRDGGHCRLKLDFQGRIPKFVLATALGDNADESFSSSRRLVTIHRDVSKKDILFAECFDVAQKLFCVDSAKPCKSEMSFMLDEGPAKAHFTLSLDVQF